MLPRNHLDSIQITFDDHRLVNNAGLLLPATLALNLGLRQLVDHHLDLGDAPGRANAGDKMMTLVASALAGGDCIDDADALRAGSTGRVLGCVVKAPSTLGTFLRSFRWGHVRQLDRVSRELLARAWAAGAGPGDAPFTIDLDSTICETYGLAKEGARHHGYTGQRGYHPLLAVAAGTGDVLMARLREGRANTARGAAHFLRETVGRVRHAGATGQLTVRADSGFYTHGVVSVCRKTKVRFSITIRQRASLRNLIEAIPEDAWTPIPYWMEGAADVAETAYTPFGSRPYAAPVRLIVRRVKPAPGSQLALFASYSYHGFITDRDGDTLELEADHRRHAEIENAIRDLKYGVGLNHLPSGRFAANAAWLAVQVMAHNLARWTARIGLGEQIVTTKTLRRRFFSLAGRLTRKARRLTLHLPQQLALGSPVQSCPGPVASPAASFLTAPVAPDPSATTQPPGLFAPGRFLIVSGCNLHDDLAHRSSCGPSIIPLWWLPHRASSQIHPDQTLNLRLLSPLIPCPVGSATSFRWIRGNARFSGNASFWDVGLAPFYVPGSMLALRVNPLFQPRGQIPSESSTARVKYRLTFNASQRSDR